MSTAGARVSVDGVAGTQIVTVRIGYGIDGSAVTQPVKENTSATATQTSVASSATSIILLQSSGSRLGVTIFNDSTQILYVVLSNPNYFPFVVATATTFTAQIAPGARYEVPAFYTGVIQGVWASANGFARITELT